MMDEVNNVASLKDMAFEAFYNKVLLKATTQSSVDFIRGCTAFQQKGKMGKIIREKCVKKLNDSFPKKPNASNQQSTFPADACTILDCVLDHSFSELKIKIPASYYGLFQFVLNLISIIANRAPKLTLLEITVFPTATTTSPSSPITGDYLLPFLIPNCSGLRFLKTLVLRNCDPFYLRPAQPMAYGLMNSSHKSVLSLIGKYCPKLDTLEIIDIDIKKKDIVALILGDLVDILLPTSAEGEKWSEDAVLQSLRVPAELLTPLCFSLENLTLRTHPPLLESILAFALRHFPALEAINDGINGFQDQHSIVKAIGLLYDSQHSVDKKVQQEFDDICCEVVSHVNFERNLLTSPTLHSGGLMLRTVIFGSFDNFEILRRLLQAVMFSCTQMHKMVFFGQSLWNSNDHFISKTDKEMDSLLNNFPTTLKVQRIEFFGFNSSSATIVGSILRAFSPSLKMLHLNCQTIDMESLAYCHNLEHLCVNPSDGRALTSVRAEPSQWSAETFLPSLKTLDANMCLGIWSPLFEGKSTLTYLKLKCCHIETNENPGLVWSKMPEFWPRLESLELVRCTGLSMATAAELIPQMDSLRYIKLPESMMSKDPQLTSQVVKDLASRKPSVRLLSSYSAEEPCPYQPI